MSGSPRATTCSASRWPRRQASSSRNCSAASRPISIPSHSQLRDSDIAVLRLPTPHKLMIRQVLPIDAVLPDLTAALRIHASAVLHAPTGAGKTTRVPPALLDAGFTERGRIVLLEPRRLAARAAARWMARERGCQVGEEIGYQVRFEKQCGPKTRILVVTPG